MAELHPRPANNKCSWGPPGCGITLTSRARERPREGSPRRDPTTAAVSMLLRSGCLLYLARVLRTRGRKAPADTLKDLVTSHLMVRATAINNNWLRTKQNSPSSWLNNSPAYQELLRDPQQQFLPSSSSDSTLLRSMTTLSNSWKSTKVSEGLRILTKCRQRALEACPRWWLRLIHLCSNSSPVGGHSRTVT